MDLRPRLSSPQNVHIMLDEMTELVDFIRSSSTIRPSRYLFAVPFQLLITLWSCGRVRGQPSGHASRYDSFLFIASPLSGYSCGPPRLRQRRDLERDHAASHAQPPPW
jgi:hypothetical protein